MSVKDNILFLDVFSEIIPDPAKYQEIMHYFEMEKFENTPVKSLSIGQRERVNIMRAFVHDPKVVILDEPGSNLDDRLFDKLFAFLEEENTKHKTTIIAATHHARYRDISTKTLYLDLIENA